MGLLGGLLGVMSWTKTQHHDDIVKCPMQRTIVRNFSSLFVHIAILRLSVAGRFIQAAELMWQRLDSIVFIIIIEHPTNPQKNELAY